MDFIDLAIEKQKARLSAGKAKYIPRTAKEQEEARMIEQEICTQVDRCITETILPTIIEAKKRFEKNDIKAEADLHAVTSVETKRSYVKGVKLQLPKAVHSKGGVPVVAGPSLSFSASPPYSTTIAILAYGPDNQAVFSERWDLEELTEELTAGYIKKFAEAVFR